jgi:hypothetical protein
MNRNPTGAGRKDLVRFLKGAGVVRGAVAVIDRGRKRVVICS